MWLANYLGFPHCFWFGNNMVFHPVAMLTAKETWPAFCFLSSSLFWLGLHSACQVTDAKSLYKKVKQLRLEITYANICISLLFFCIWLNGKYTPHRQAYREVFAGECTYHSSKKCSWWQGALKLS